MTGPRARLGQHRRRRCAVRYGVVIVLARIGATQFSESKLLKIYEKMKTAKTPPADPVANRTVESSLGLDRINLEAIGGGAKNLKIRERAPFGLTANGSRAT